MTYCVGIRLNAGLVFLSDSRTNAGMDQISTFRKMMIYEVPGERFMVMLSAGNLSISQSVRELLQVEKLDNGTEHFQPSNLEFTSVDVGNPAWNVIPAQAQARFNIRYNDRHTRESLRALIEERVTRASGNRIKAHVVWEPSNSDAFLTQPGPFTDLVSAAIEEVTGRRPELNTGGGTSDARFITHYCPVLEFGLVGQTMHQIDERTPVSDLEKLTKIYRGVLDRYFA